MKRLGILLALLGIIIAGAALSMDTTAATNASAIGVPASVYNLGRLQGQLLTFIAGCSMAVAGVALAAAGEVRDTVRRGVNFIDRGPAPGRPDAVVPGVQIVPAYRELTPEETAEQQAKLADGNRAADRLALKVLAAVGAFVLLVIGIAFFDGSLTDPANTSAANADSVSNGSQP